MDDLFHEAAVHDAFELVAFEPAFHRGLEGIVGHDEREPLGLRFSSRDARPGAPGTALYIPRGMVRHDIDDVRFLFFSYVWE